MDCPKIPPNFITNSIKNWISDYLSSITLGIFIGTSQGQKSKGDVSVHKKTSNMETNQLIGTVITVLVHVLVKNAELGVKTEYHNFTKN